MKKITKEQIDAVTNYLLGSVLPSCDVQKVVNLLKNLPPVESGNTNESLTDKS